MTSKHQSGDDIKVSGGDINVVMTSYVIDWSDDITVVWNALNI